MSFEVWYEECVLLACSYGFTRKQVEVFKLDLREHFINGKTPEKAVMIEF